jgi:hypothetical protein
MKRKHGRADPQIKVITDPKKLAWLQAQIEKLKGGGQTQNVLKRPVTSSKSRRVAFSSYFHSER